MFGIVNRQAYRPFEILRQEIVSECKTQVYACISVLIMHQITAHNYSLAVKTEKDLLHSQRSKAFLYKRFIFEDTVVPKLQEIVLTENITYQDCFPHGFTAGGIAKNIDNYLCNASSCSHHLKMAYRLKGKIELMFKKNIRYLGTIISKSNVMLANEYLNGLLQRLNEDQPVGMTFTNVSFGLHIKGIKGIVQDEFLSSKIECTDCYQGTFKTILRILKETQFQPHVLDLKHMQVSPLCTLYFHPRALRVYFCLRPQGPSPPDNL